MAAWYNGAWIMGINGAAATIGLCIDAPDGAPPTMRYNNNVTTPCTGTGTAAPLQIRRNSLTRRDSMAFVLLIGGVRKLVIVDLIPEEEKFEGRIFKATLPTVAALDIDDGSASGGRPT
jgi:hypothetical protein